MVKKLLLRLFLKPFQLKGAVLKGATAEVHSVSPATAPATAAAESVNCEGPLHRRCHYSP
jgi:hypothetical protein